MSWIYTFISRSTKVPKWLRTRAAVKSDEPLWFLYEEYDLAEEYNQGYIQTKLWCHTYCGAIFTGGFIQIFLNLSTYFKVYKKFRNDWKPGQLCSRLNPCGFITKIMTYDQLLIAHLLRCHLYWRLYSKFRSSPQNNPDIFLVLIRPQWAGILNKLNIELCISEYCKKII